MNAAMPPEKSSSSPALWVVVVSMLGSTTQCGCAAGRDLSRSAKVIVKHHQGEPSTSTFGQITGRVTDVENGVPLVGANVWIPEQSLGDAADTQGSFHIVHIPAGKHIVRVRLLGYSDFEFELILSPGETVRADVTMLRFEGEMRTVPVRE